MAAVSSGPKGRPTLLVDEASQQRFLVDTSSSSPVQGANIWAMLVYTDRSLIAYWGVPKMHLAAVAGGSCGIFSWQMWHCPSSELGWFGLLEDLGEMRLLAHKGGWSQHLVEPTGGGMFKVLPKPTHHLQCFLVTEGRPVITKYRRLDNNRLEATKKELAELEKQGIIRQSSSNWASPLHMVKKSDGTWRPCGATGFSICRHSRTSTCAPTLQI